LAIKNVNPGDPVSTANPAVVNFPVPLSPLPDVPVEPETFDVEVFHFGLPNHERYFPTFFPTLPSDSASVWEMIDNGARCQEVIVAALQRVGYSGKKA
jgi:hypothetical protein